MTTKEKCMHQMNYLNSMNQTNQKKQLYRMSQMNQTNPNILYSDAEKEPETNQKGDNKGNISRSITSFQRMVNNKLKDCIKEINKNKRTDLILNDLKNKRFPDGNAIISKRKSEINEVFNVIGKKKNKNIIIFGEDGTGRKQIIEGLAYSIKIGTCPGKFKNSLIFEVPVEQFSTEANTADEIGIKILSLVQIAHNFPHTIFYIKDFKKLIDYNVIESFQMVFDSAICIGIMDRTEEMVFDLLKYHFISINVNNPERENIYSLIRGSIKEIQEFHNVVFTINAFKQILEESLTSTYETKIGDVLDIADEAASIAENRGLKYVGIKSILETNRYNINAMLQNSEDKNNFYAAHEAGHAIVALHYNVGIDTISIIPKDDGVTGGFNLFEVDKNSLASKDDTLQSIEIDLGGYAGTLIKGYPLTYGAVSDLIEANKLERAMFLYLGMERDKPISYLNDISGEIEFPYMSNEMKNELDRKVQTNISKRLENAKKIIKDNENKFNIITLALKKKGFLTKKEVLALYKGEITLESIPDIRTMIFND